MANERRRKVNMQDVGKAVGVSPATVSMALSGHPKISDDTRLRVLRICRELGYPVDRLKKRATSHEAGRYAFLVFGSSREDATTTGIVHDSASIAASRDITLEIAIFPEMPDIQDMQQRIRDYVPRCNGLFISGIVPQPLRQTLADLPIPCVVLGNILADTIGKRDPFLRAVVSNEMEMGRFATVHLLRKHHRRIAFLFAGMPPGLYASRWYDGWRLALADARMPIDLSLVWTIRSDAEAAASLIETLSKQDDPPTAFVIPDALTLPCLLAAGASQKLGMTPETTVVGGDVDIFGFGDFPIITEDGPSVIGVGLDLLNRLRMGDEPPCADLIVPYITKNLDFSTSA